MFRELCGDTTLKNVILVTNMWDDVSHNAGESREKELSTSFFKSALDQGARMTRHHNTEQSARDVVRMIMGNCPVVVQIQRELVDENRKIIHTSAGQIINRELNELIRRHQASLNELREEMKQASREEDEGKRQELEEEKRELQEQIRKVKENSKAAASNYAKAKRGMEARVKEMEQKAKREREQLQAKYDQEINELQRSLQDMANASKADRAAMEEKIQNLENKRNEAIQRGCCVVM